MPSKTSEEEWNTAKGNEGQVPEDRKIMCPAVRQLGAEHEAVMPQAVGGTRLLT